VVCTNFTLPSPARTEDAAAESDSSNVALCNNCSKALQKLLVCARCKTATYCSKDCQVHKITGKRGEASH
jgi:sulfatase maturation enzyme AslB (radical SAM superfamily)